MSAVFKFCLHSFHKLSPPADIDLTFFWELMKCKVNEGSTGELLGKESTVGEKRCTTPSPHTAVILSCNEKDWLHCFISPTTKSNSYFIIHGLKPSIDMLGFTATQKRHSTMPRITVPASDKHF